METQPPQMTLADFEKLVLRLSGVIDKIETKETLLKHTIKILKADIAFLVIKEGSPSSQSPFQLDMVWPSSEEGWVRQHYLKILSELIEDTPGDPSPENTKDTRKGFTLDGREMIIDEQNFTDGLVVFEDKVYSSLHQMVLLRKASAMPTASYNSYHCWIAWLLLKPFTQALYKKMFYDERARRIKAEKDLYIRLDHQLVIPLESIQNEMVRLNMIKEGNPETDRELAGLKLLAETAKWISLNLKDVFKGKEGKKFKSDDIENMIQWLDKNIGYQNIAQNTWENHIKPILQAALSQSSPEKDTDQPPNTSSPIDSTRSKMLNKENWKDWRHIDGLPVLNLWLHVIRDAEADDEPAAGVKVSFEKVITAMDLTKIWLVHELTLTCSRGEPNQADPEKSSNKDKSAALRMGRNTLRLYFGWLLLGAEKLKSEYISTIQGSGDICRDRPAGLPLDVCRNFISQLGRYLVHTVFSALLDGASSLSARQEPISAREALDALLFLTDRYAHMELGVDPRLNIGKHLGQGAFAEVEHYLTRPFYRDHLLHVIDVFLIGHLLLETRFIWLNGEKKTLLEFIPLLFKDGDAKSVPGNQIEDWKKNWAVAALFHDIGYQLGDVGNIGNDNRKIKRFFNLRGKVLVDHLDPNRMENHGKGGVNPRDCFLSNLADRLSDDNNPWLPEKMACSLDDHGILSSLRIAQLLLHYNSTHHKQDERSQTGSITTYHHALHAIAHHNLFSCPVEMKTHPLSCLLRLCDEIQDWGRKRVDMERIVKDLYIAIDGNALDSAGGEENLEELLIDGLMISEKDSDLAIENSGPEFHFRINYRDSTEAKFDVVTTFLSKAYNLQNVELDIPEANNGNELAWELDLWFPWPEEYHWMGVCETGIYSRFIQECRELPVLPVEKENSGEDKSTPGLMVKTALRSEWPFDKECLAGMDRIRILVSGKADGKKRVGWIDIDPSIFFGEFIAFKEKFFSSRKNKWFAQYRVKK
ncbi:MAG: hypothetical protein M0T82_12820 [Desulfobacteraceae bacterium]|nr:hypothetical protein [Desulfobacteraceae bacterium]